MERMGKDRTDRMGTDGIGAEGTGPERIGRNGEGTIGLNNNWRLNMSVKKVFGVREEAHFKKTEREAILWTWKNVFNHKLPTSEQVIAEAKKKTSRLHDVFDWDKDRVFEGYLKQRAQYIIRSVVIKEINLKTKRVVSTIPHRVLVQTKRVHARPSSAYIDVRAAAKDVELQREMLRNAYIELEQWHERYCSLSGFMSHFSAISNEIRRLQPILKSIRVKTA